MANCILYVYVYIITEKLGLFNYFTVYILFIFI